MSRKKHPKKIILWGNLVDLELEATEKAKESALEYEVLQEERLKGDIKLNELEIREARAFRAYRNMDYTDDELCSTHSHSWPAKSHKVPPPLSKSTARFEEDSSASHSDVEA